MPTKKSSKKTARKSAKRRLTKNVRKPARAKQASMRSAVATSKKAKTPVRPKVAAKAVKKVGRGPSKSVAARSRAGAAAKPARVATRRTPPQRPVETPPHSLGKEIAPGIHPAAAHGFDPKAERGREYVKRMKSVESQRVEEHHAMTRHRKNQ